MMPFLLALVAWCSEQAQGDGEVELTGLQPAKLLVFLQQDDFELSKVLAVTGNSEGGQGGTE